jgi:hypothetical protein
MCAQLVRGRGPATLGAVVGGCTNRPATGGANNYKWVCPAGWPAALTAPAPLGGCSKRARHHPARHETCKLSRKTRNMHAKLHDAEHAERSTLRPVQADADALVSSCR